MYMHQCYIANKVTLCIAVNNANLPFSKQDFVFNHDFKNKNDTPQYKKVNSSNSFSKLKLPEGKHIFHSLFYPNSSKI